MTSMGTVYIHVNLSDHKAYVGQTWDRHQRELDHRNPSCKSAFSKAVQSRGWNGFSHYYSDELDTQFKLDNLERLWIVLLEATDPQHGYNRRFGGARGKHTESTKRLLREARAKQGPPSEDGRRRISERHRGQKYNLGHYPSDETRLKMSLAHKGIKQTPEWIARRSEAINRVRAIKKWTVSEDARLRFVERLKGNTYTLGYRHTEEAKKKMSIARKGKKQDPECVKRRIAASVAARLRNKQSRNLSTC